MFANLDKSAGAALRVLQVEIAVSELNLRVGSGHRFFHYHDLVHGVTTDLTPCFVQFVVSRLSTFCGDYYYFVFYLQNY
jgi:hypothetical protein